MRSKQTEIFIRVPHVATATSNLTKKAYRKFGEGQYWSPASFRLRRNALQVRSTNRADRAFGTHVLNLMFRPRFKVPYKLCATSLIRRRIFSQNLRARWIWVDENSHKICAHLTRPSGSAEFLPPGAVETNEK